MGIAVSRTILSSYMYAATPRFKKKEKKKQFVNIIMMYGRNYKYFMHQGLMLTNNCIII